MNDMLIYTIYVIGCDTCVYAWMIKSLWLVDCIDYAIIWLKLISEVNLREY